MTVINVTEETAEKAHKWNWSIPKLVSKWLEGNEVMPLCSLGTREPAMHRQCFPSYMLFVKFLKLLLHVAAPVQTADEDPVVSHHPMDEALEILMGFAGSNFRKQSEVWSAALPNKTP